jgi:hypothetical protein
MKYQRTSRTLCLLFHAIIVIAFGALGIYFGFFVTPQYFTNYAKYFCGYLFDGGYFLYLELAVLGLSLFSISIKGLAEAIKGFTDPNDDQSVAASLTSFVSEGWLGSIFFLLQGLLFFDLLSFGESKNLAFVIIMSLLLAIILLIATNIPMVRLYDGKDQMPLLKSLSSSAFLTFAWMTVVVFVTLILNWMQGSFSAYGLVNSLLMIILVVSLLATASFVAVYAVLRRKGAKGLGAAGYFSSLGILILGGGLIAFSISDMLLDPNRTQPIHFVSKDLSWLGYGFDVMAIVLGAVLLIGSVYFFVATKKSSKVQELTKKA